MKNSVALLVAGVALALISSACAATAPSPPPTTTHALASPTPPPPTPTPASEVPDAEWVPAIRRLFPELADLSDEDVVLASRTLCDAYRAQPTKETVRAAMTAAQSDHSFSVDKAQVWIGLAAAHSCPDLTVAMTDASAF